MNYTQLFYPEGSPLLYNRIPKGNMKPELNQTQAIYRPEGSKPKVCVTTTIVSQNVSSAHKRGNICSGSKMFLYSRVRAGFCIQNSRSIQKFSRPRN